MTAFKLVKQYAGANAWIIPRLDSLKENKENVGYVFEKQ